MLPSRFSKVLNDSSSARGRSPTSCGPWVVAAEGVDGDFSFFVGLDTGGLDLVGDTGSIGTSTGSSLTVSGGSDMVVPVRGRESPDRISKR